ncbi:hypothetical protein N7456_005356 [Penicillium angulare]|uniref:F-box domain-containing protein n=1 Tax=Penicillium angulare TaxID=116970 RepID=A0A9W9FYD3_9EURO|nr:hypothetical protein N7456_005356 [Penicillium angulare]
MPPIVSGHHERGQKLYQKQDFKAAIEAFGEALTHKSSDAIGVLDNRAATYCKLEQYEQARRDARHMIKKASQDERGYLRCAKVLLLEGKPEKALEIYAYGLKTLGSKHPRREVLEQLHKKLESRMLPNRKDPFTILPFEMAMLVIEQFSFKQIVGIMRVCKGWQRFLGSISQLWMKIDFTGARGTVPFNAISSCIRRSRGLLTHATIKSLPLPQTSKSLEFLSRCPHIEHLDISANYGSKEFFDKFKRHKKLQNLTFSSEIPVTKADFLRLLHDYPKLDRIALWNIREGQQSSASPWPDSLPNLRGITLASKTSYTSSIMQHGLWVPNLISDKQPHPLPRLQELRLDWDPPTLLPVSYPICFDRPDRQDASIDDDPAMRPPPLLRQIDFRGILPSPNLFTGLPKGLEYLRFSGGMARPLQLTPPTETLPRLHTIIFVDAGWVTFDILQQFLFDAQPPVRKLYLDQCFNVSWHEFLLIMEHKGRNPELDKLEELGVSHWRDVDDMYASVLRKSFPSLRVLDLSYTSITGCTIREFTDSRTSELDKGAKLDRIIVRGCESISLDAVAYGRQNGLEVIT